LVASMNVIKTNMPKLISERGFAFGLDLANQFGNGGAKSIYNKVQAGATSEADLIQKMRDEAVKRLENSTKIPAKAKPAIVKAAKERRDFFINSKDLDDGPLNLGAPPPPLPPIPLFLG